MVVYLRVQKTNQLPKLVVVGSNPIARSKLFISLDLKPRQGDFERGAPLSWGAHEGCDLLGTYPRNTAVGRFSELYEQLVQLEQRIANVTQRLDRVFRGHPVCRKLAAVPGIGPLTATALLAADVSPENDDTSKLE